MKNFSLMMIKMTTMSIIMIPMKGTTTTTKSEDGDKDADKE